MIYNDSFMANSTNIVQLIIGLSQAMNNNYFLGNILLMTFFIIFLLMSLRHGWIEVLTIDGFLTTILAILLWGTGMIAATMIAVPLVIFIICLLFLLFS